MHLVVKTGHAKPRYGIEVGCRCEIYKRMILQDCFDGLVSYIFDLCT